MKILLYSHNYAPEKIGIGKYNSELCETIAGYRDVEVTVLTSWPHYPFSGIGRRFFISYQRSIENNVELIRCPIYVPRKPTALKRMISLISFAMSSFFALLYLSRGRYDVLIHIIPSYVTSLNVFVFRFLTKAKIVAHIQDLEVNLFLNLFSRNEMLKSLTLSLEKYFLRKYSLVTSISDAMITELTNKLGRGYDLFPNWANSNSKSEVSSIENVGKTLCALGIPDNKKIILYSGNMGEKQGLEIVIDAAKVLHGVGDVHFVIIGEGGSKKKLQSLAMSESLNNISFLPLQNDEIFKRILSNASCHLVLQKPGIDNFVLPSKLTNILSVGGNCVVATSGKSELIHVLKKNPGIFEICEPGNLGSLVEAIRVVLLKEGKNRVALDYSAANLDQEKIILSYYTKLKEVKEKNVR